MDRAPLPFSLRLTLRVGTVYYFIHRDLHSPEPHYFIVVNNDPRADTVILLAVASSQIEKISRRRTGMPPATLVPVEPSDYAPFTKSTLIDCNHIFELSRDELIAKFDSRDLRHHPDLPASIMTRVREGILASPMVNDAHKEIIRSC